MSSPQKPKVSVTDTKIASQVTHSDTYADTHTARHNLGDKSTLGELLGIYVRGMAMGAADIVPGVSGGTIALIAGIYQRLINAIGNIGPNLWLLWRRRGGLQGIVDVWRHVDATFLLCLLAGIATSFMTLAGGIKYLLAYQPLLIWSFFFGLVIATVYVLLAEVERWNLARLSLFITGIAAAALISMAPIIPAAPSLPYLFVCGAIAICAMILPGISGSFILLLLGAYDTVLDAVHTFNLSVIITVIAGMATGLLLFTRILKWLLARYYQGTLALLTGFIAGSLVKIWPWKTAAAGNMLPWHFPTGAHWLTTLSLMAVGAILVLLISWWGNRRRSID